MINQDHFFHLFTTANTVTNKKKHLISKLRVYHLLDFKARLMITHVTNRLSYNGLRMKRT